MSNAALLEVRKIIQSSNPLKTCIQQAVQGKVTGARSLYWRILIGLLKAPETKPEDENDLLEEWEAAMDMRRADFKKRQDALKGASTANSPNAVPKKTKFGDSSSDDEDASTDNPLSTAAGSTYAQTFERSKLEATVEKDLGRLWSDDPFFEQEFVLQTIRSLLMLYCEEESELGYRQGMHELASFIVYVLHHDADSATAMAAMPAESGVKETVEYICSSTFLLADAYWIFRRLMDTPGLHLAQWYYVLEASPREGGEEAEITFVANLVQNTMLRNVDPKLSKHLTDLNIHATSYLIRWLRLLFLREFSFSNVARLWDCMFADYAWTALLKQNKKEYNVSQSVMPHIAVSMLIFVKEELLQSDFSYTLRRLMRFPPIEDVNGFISHSIRRKYHNKDLATLLEDYKPSDVKVEASRNAPTYSPSTVAASPAVNDRNQALGKSLAEVVTSLERKWFPSSDQTDEQKASLQEDYLIAIAELKRVRDVLLGLVAE